MFDRSDDDEPSGYAGMIVYGYRDGEMTSQKLLLPTTLSHHVRSLNSQAHSLREAERELEREGKQPKGDQTFAEARLQGLKEESAKEADAPSVELEVIDLDPKDMVPCINREDVLAQKKAAEGNTKFQERNRTTAMKAVTKVLLDRPMTRRIGRPQDVDAAVKRLAEIAPHIPALVDAVRIPLMVSAKTGAPPMIAPILLVGPAGVGKSHVSVGLAEILGVPVHKISYAAAGAAGNTLSGADKAWANTTTGVVFDLLAMGDYANPVLCLDELDKASMSFTTANRERDPTNELLALLEPLTAKEHRDRCAEIRVDARHIVWIATANNLSTISQPLLSRFKLIFVGKPDARAAVTIALSVASAVAKEMGAAIKPPRGEVLQFLATINPRVMRQIWTNACGWAVSQGRNKVTMAEIESALGYQADPQDLRH